MIWILFERHFDDFFQLLLFSGVKQEPFFPGYGRRRLGPIHHKL
jgi:hypothetical protein